MVEKPSLTDRLATGVVNWNNPDLENWRPIVPYPDILDRMVEAGYRATEYAGEAWGTDPARLLADAGSRGLAWTGTYTWVELADGSQHDETIRSMIPVFELLQKIGAHDTVVADRLRPHRIALAGRVPADGSASLSDTEMGVFVDGLHKLGQKGLEYGIKVHYHNHVGSTIEAPHEVAAIARRLNTAYADFCFDTGHYAYGGGDPTQWITDNYDKIGYLHLKDVDSAALAESKAQGYSFLEALTHYVFSPLGEGTADIPAVLQVLQDHHFDGWIVIEQDTCPGDATETARQNYEYVRAWESR